MLSAVLVNRIIHAGARLSDFQVKTVLMVAFVFCLVLGPLLVFAPALLAAKRKGIAEYGALGSGVELMRTKRSIVLRILALCSIVVLAKPAHAEDHSWVVAPEFDAFVKLSDRARLFLLGDVAHNVTTDLTDGEVGVHLDYTLKPRLRRWLQDANWERDRYLWLRAGYLRMHSLDTRESPSAENRLIAQMTARLGLPRELWLVQRAQADFRDIDGKHSKRYRYRLGVEREFDAGGTVMVPYAQAEFFYDTRYESWSRRLYQVGVEIQLTKTWRIEPYLSRQNDSRSASANVDTLGVVLKYYR